MTEDISKKEYWKMTETEEVGIKYDEQKPMWHLLPLDLVEECVQVLTYGAKKYKPYSWQKVPEGHDRYFSALLRHIKKYKNGEILDAETGLSHLAHAMCNLIFCYEYDKGFGFN